MTTLTLSVPSSLSALYFVPLGHREDAVALARRHLQSAVGEPLRDLAVDALDAQRVVVEVWPTRDLPTPPYDLLAAMGSSPDQISALAGAARLAVIAATGKPGHGTHEWVARAVAATIGFATAAPLVDVFTPRMIDVGPALRSLPPDQANPPLARWVWVPYSPGPAGSWVTTRGLGRFGLPELQTLAVPDALAPAWCYALTGIASRLLEVWGERLATWGEPEPAFVELPDVLVVSHRDVERSYELEPDPSWLGSVEVRLTLDPLHAGHAAFLTVNPPPGVDVPHATFLADACESLRGRMPPPRPAATECAACAAGESAAAYPRWAGVD